VSRTQIIGCIRKVRRPTLENREFVSSSPCFPYFRPIPQRTYASSPPPPVSGGDYCVLENRRLATTSVKILATVSDVQACIPYSLFTILVYNEQNTADRLRIGLKLSGIKFNISKDTTSGRPATNCHCGRTLWRRPHPPNAFADLPPAVRTSWMLP